MVTPELSCTGIGSEPQCVINRSEQCVCSMIMHGRLMNRSVNSVDTYHAEARHDDDDLVLPDGAEAKSPSFQEIDDKRMST